RVRNIKLCGRPAGKWRRTIGIWNFSPRKHAKHRQADVRRIARGTAASRRTALSPQTSLSPADARRQTQPRTTASLGAEPLLLPVDHSDEGRDHSFALDRSVVPPRLA